MTVHQHNAMERTVCLGGKKGTRCSIIVGRDRLEADLHSASVITRIVSRLTGRPVDIDDSWRDQRPGTLILVGLSALDSFARKSTQDVSAELKGAIRRLRRRKNREQGFVIHFVRCGRQNAIVLAGCTDQGTFYAAQTFANRLYFNHERELVVDAEDVVTAPAFRYRSLAGGLGGPDWLGSRQFERDFGREDGTTDYRAFIDWIAGMKVNNLNVWMLDFMWGLAYPSAKYPEAVNRHHPNVRHEFFGEMLRYAKKNYIDVWLQVNLPDCWIGIIKVYPHMAADDLDFDSIPRRGQWDAFLRGDMGYSEYDRMRHSASSVSTRKKEVLDFWRGFWEELLTRYPEIAGVGGQFGEQLGDKKLMSLQFHYFKTMADLATRHNPKINTWSYQAAGALDILARRKQLPNFTFIGWHRPVTEDFDWYLSHGGAGLWYETEFKKDALTARRLGLAGIQKRMVCFSRQEKVLSAVGELAWDPSLSFPDLAHYSALKLLRRKDQTMIRAYTTSLRTSGGEKAQGRAPRAAMGRLRKVDEVTPFVLQVKDYVAANVPVGLPRCVLRQDDIRDERGARILTVRRDRGGKDSGEALACGRWRNARFSMGFVLPDGKPAIAEVGVAAVYDENQIQFCFACADNAAEMLKSTALRASGLLSAGDEWTGQDDMLVLFIQADERAPVYYQLAFNTEGIQVRQRRDPVRDTAEYSYDGDMRIFASVQRGYWLAEVTVPYSTLGVEGKRGATWRVNFHRMYRDRLIPAASWSFSGNNFHQPDRFGKLVFGG